MVSWLNSFTLFNIFVLLLIVLLSKDPFSGQNAISELEPSPDAMHYLSPVKSVWEGHGFGITYQGRSISTLVPPLYSLTLIPFYGLFDDIRSFYFLNVFLIILSAFIFLKIILSIFDNWLIQILIFFGFCTNFILFWYPSYPMSENLLIFLATASLMLLIPPVSNKKALLVGLMAALMFATKYVAWIQGFSLIASWGFLVWGNVTDRKIKIRLIGFSLITLMFGLSLSILFEYLTKGSEILPKIASNLAVVWRLLSLNFFSSGLAAQSRLFNQAPFWDNLVRYIFGFIGGSVTVAGQGFILVSPIIGFGAILAILFLSLGYRSFLVKGIPKPLFFYLSCSLILTLFYLSNFQIVDARYFFAFIPVLILLFGFSLQVLVNLSNRINRASFARLFLVIIAVIFFGSSLPLLVSGFETNLNHSDTSQNYQAISTLNGYFLSHHFDSRPTVITILSPYQIDFFSTGSFELLPLSKKQYFTNTEFQTWGIAERLDYLDIYRSYLEQGRLLFVSTYHTNQDFVFWKDYQAISQNFQLTKVTSGCKGECDLYQIDRTMADSSY